MKRFLCAIILVLLTVLTVCEASASEAEAEQRDILTVSAVAPELGVKAKAWALMDVNTGTFIAGNNENELMYPASVTKIMTLLLVCEAIEQGKLTLDMEIVCSHSAADKGGSQIWLEAGEIMTVHDLLKATVVYSANDACCLLGETIAGSEEAFCHLMNNKARELGMINTNFDNCTGLDDDTDTHKTTAADIAIMSCALLKYGVIKEYTGIWMDTLRGGETQLVNTNKLIRTYPGATGLKTGTTSKAGCCVAASAERDGLELVAVVLGAENSNDRFNGAKAILDYGFANYEIYTPDSSGAYPESISVSHGTKESVSLSHFDCDEFLVNKGIRDKIEAVTEISESITAPFEKGSVVGEITYKINDKVLGKSQVFTAESCEEMTFVKAILSILKSVKKY